MTPVVPAMTRVPDPPNATAARVAGGDGLGKQDFLRLLIAQLRNQDPMRPMEDREFITQLAQFRSLEALENVSKQLEVLRRDQQLSQAALLVGRRVEATTEDGSAVAGVVSEVRLVDGSPKLAIGEAVIDVARVTTVGGSAATSSATSSSAQEQIRREEP